MMGSVCRCCVVLLSMGSGMVVVLTRIAGYPSLLLVLLFSHCLVEVVYFFKACLGGFCWDSYGHYV